MAHSCSLNVLRPHRRRHCRRLWRVVAALWLCASLQILAGALSAAAPWDNTATAGHAGLSAHQADQWLDPEAGDEQERECQDAPDCLLSSHAKFQSAAVVFVTGSVAALGSDKTLCNSTCATVVTAGFCPRCNAPRGPPATA